MTVFAGDPIGASDLNAVAGLYAYGNAEPTNNTTTLSSDLVLSVPSAGRFTIFGVYFYRSTAAGGFKVNVMGDGSGVPHANIRWGIEGNQTMNFGNNALSITVPGTGFYRASVWAVLDNLSGGAGTVTLQYAQTTSNAGPTGPLNGRWLRMHQLL